MNFSSYLANTNPLFKKTKVLLIKKLVILRTCLKRYKKILYYSLLINDAIKKSLPIITIAMDARRRSGQELALAPPPLTYNKIHHVGDLFLLMRGLSLHVGSFYPYRGFFAS